MAGAAPRFINQSYHLEYLCAPFEACMEGSDRSMYFGLEWKRLSDWTRVGTGNVWESYRREDHLKMEMEMEIPSVKASANSDIIFFFTSAQDGNKLLDDERLSLADDLKKAHDQNQNKSK
ncbi:hypothetical protein Tco_0252704 [Tanacetum coccineum]